MFNEYYDYIRGLDTKDSVGIGGTIVRDGVAPGTVRNLAVLFYVISLFIGIYICMESSWWVAVIGALSMLVGYLYNAALADRLRSPFGELFSGLFIVAPVIIHDYVLHLNRKLVLELLLGLAQHRSSDRSDQPRQQYS